MTVSTIEEKKSEQAASRPRPPRPSAVSQTQPEATPFQSAAPASPHQTRFSSPSSTSAARSIAPLGSSAALRAPRSRSKTPTPRDPNPNSPSTQSPPSFSNQSHSEGKQSSITRGRDRPKTWSGRSQRPLWTPGRPAIRSSNFLKEMTEGDSRSSLDECERRGRSLNRGSSRFEGDEILLVREDEVGQEVSSFLPISIEPPPTTPASPHTVPMNSDRSSMRDSSRGRGRGIGGSRLGPLPSHQDLDQVYHNLPSHSHQHQHDHSHHQSNSRSPHHLGSQETPLDKEAGAGIRADSQDQKEQAKERAHFLSVLEAFDQYLPYCLAANSSRRRSLYALPRAHQALLRDVGSALPSPTLDTGSESIPDASSHSHPPLRGVKSRLDEIDDRIRRNADVLNEIVQDSRSFLGADEGMVKNEAPGRVGMNAEREQELGTGRSTGISQAAVSSPEEGFPSENSSSNPSSKEFEVVNSGKDGTTSFTDESKQQPNGLLEAGSVRPSASGLTSNSTTPGIKVALDADSAFRTKSARQEARKQARQRLKSAREAEYGVDKIRSTLKQLVRDWSSHGSLERDLAYGPIIKALEERFGSIPEDERNLVRILVPGAGLGRLAFELAWRGFSTQGNEFSFYMLLASHFVLNKTKKVDEHLIYPYIHSSSNWRSAEDMLQEVSFPDVKPSEMPHQVDFSMVAGEFIEVYSAPSEASNWDAVATCFFIDTARNFIRYLEVFNRVLPLGGLWINVGPLLWHYEGGNGGGSDESDPKEKVLQDDISIELTLEEVLECTRRMGFEIQEQRSLPEMPYTGNPSGMLCYQYKPEFWVAKKVAHITPAGDA